MQSSVIATSLWAPDENLRAHLWPLQQHLDGTAATFGIWEGFGNGTGGSSAILRSSGGVIVSVTMYLLVKFGCSAPFLPAVPLFSSVRNSVKYFKMWDYLLSKEQSTLASAWR